jgi:hypothetical protein
MASAWLGLSLFSGVNNIDDPARLRPDDQGVWPLVTATNIDIDNTHRIKRRYGYTSKVVLTRPHSLWADGDACFFVYQDKLYKLNTDYTYTLVRSGLLAGMRLSFARVNDRVYYSNGTQIGYVDADYVDNALTNPLITFKYPLPAGKFLEFFRGRIYSAHGPVLSYSDVLADYYDRRTNIIQFPSDIQMVIAVHGGLYVSDSDAVHFISGLTPTEANLEEGVPYPAIPYTGVKVDAHFIGSGDMGDSVIWTTTKGICVGDSSGKVVNVTDKRYSMGIYAKGAAVFDSTEGLFKYIAALTN